MYWNASRDSIFINVSSSFINSQSSGMYVFSMREVPISAAWFSLKYSLKKIAPSVLIL